MTARVSRVRTRTGDPAWWVTDYRLARSLLEDDRLGRSHPDPDRAPRLSRSASFDRPRPAAPTEASDHRRIRRLLLRGLGPARVGPLRPRLVTLVNGLLDGLLSAPPPADLHSAVSVPLPSLVTCELLGLPAQARGWLCDRSAEASDMGGGRRAAEGFAALARGLAAPVAERRREPRADLLTDLARAYPPPLAARLAAELFIAGHQTTTAAIDKGLVRLLTDPELRSRLADRPELLPVVVEEIVRLPSPVGAPAGGRVLPRYATVDLDLAGAEVRAGDLVLLAVDQANLDPEVFPRAEQLDPDRTLNPHLGFGHGRYACVGAALARLELEVLFGILLTRLPGLRLAVPVDQLRTDADQLAGGVRGLPARW